jgi:Na+/glutamate symporter
MAWFVLSIWFLFNGAGYIELTAAVVTLFFAVVIAIPSALWLVWRKSTTTGTADAQNQTESFRDWARGDFLMAAADKRKGLEAAAEMLLPLAAVAFGLTAIGIVFDLAVYGRL